MAVSLTQGMSRARLTSLSSAERSPRPIFLGKTPSANASDSLTARRILFSKSSVWPRIPRPSISPRHRLPSSTHLTTRGPPRTELYGAHGWRARCVRRGRPRRLLQEMDPQLPLIQPQSLEQIANQSPSVFLRRYPSYLIGSLAALALALAVVGLYGLISHMVLQRTREIGIRVALGAQRRDILKMVLRQGIRATLAGVAIGVPAGLALTRLLRSMLYGVTPGDWLTFLSVALLILVVALAACSIPARRATRVHR